MIFIAIVFNIWIGLSRSEISVCENEQQRRILPNLLNCQVRNETVALSLPNDTFVRVIPGHVTVRRCGGSCDSRHVSCLPTEVRNKTVQVLLFSRAAHAGEDVTVCSDVLVEEHVTCGCSCRTPAHECGRSQRFLPTECRCICANDAQRAACLQSGKFWDRNSCQCLCQDPLTFPECPTGYRFDWTDSCTCVTSMEIASIILEIVVLIASCSVVLTAIGIMQCYRKKMGIFYTNRLQEGARTNAIEFRTIFRQISQGQRPSSLMNFLSYSHIPDSSNEELLNEITEASNALNEDKIVKKGNQALNTRRRIETLIEEE